MADRDDMDLQSFISSTLVQIVQGVKDAQDQVAEIDAHAHINPGDDHRQYVNAPTVDFDVAVTVSASDSGGGKAGIRIAAVELGGEKSAETRSEAVSRIRFSVPVAAPLSPGPKPSPPKMAKPQRR